MAFATMCVCSGLASTLVFLRTAGVWPSYHRAGKQFVSETNQMCHLVTLFYQMTPMRSSFCRNWAPSPPGGSSVSCEHSANPGTSHPIIPQPAALHV